MFVVNWFLGGRFSTIGLTVFNQNNTTLSDIFPKVAKCTYENYGPSGSIQIIDAICVLPLNVVNEKTYIVLWFWLIILGILTLLCLIYRCVTVCCRSIRVYLLTARVHALNKRRATQLLDKLSWGDWFMLYQMNKNMDPGIFEEVLLNIELRNNGKKDHHVKIAV